jgi:hypothetical protein
MSKSRIKLVNLLPFPTDDPKIKLSTLVLIIIAGFILGLMIIIFYKPIEGTSAITYLHQNGLQDSTLVNYKDSAFAHSIEIIKHIQEEKKDYREFILKISQMVLLNLLLPVLTAVLGYKLGSKDD